jgi:hypothetical protein
MGPFASSFVKFETIQSSKEEVHLKAAIANQMVSKNLAIGFVHCLQGLFSYPTDL